MASESSSSTSSARCLPYVRLVRGMRVIVSNLTFLTAEVEADDFLTGTTGSSSLSLCSTDGLVI